MEYLLVIIATPIVIWALDRVLYRGEFTGAFLEAVHLLRPAEKKTRRVIRRISADDVG